MPGHLFDLAEGSIPSATTGIERLLHREESIFFSSARTQFSQLQQNFWGGSHAFLFASRNTCSEILPSQWPRVIRATLASVFDLERTLVLHLIVLSLSLRAASISRKLVVLFSLRAAEFRRNCFRALVVLFWLRAAGVFPRSSYCFGFRILFYRFRFELQTLSASSPYCFRFGPQKLFSRARRIALASGCRNFHALVVLFWLRAARFFTRSSYCFDFGLQALFASSSYRFASGRKHFCARSSYRFRFGPRTAFLRVLVVSFSLRAASIFARARRIVFSSIVHVRPIVLLFLASGCIAHLVVSTTLRR